MKVRMLRCSVQGVSLKSPGGLASALGCGSIQDCRNRAHMRTKRVGLTESSEYMCCHAGGQGPVQVQYIRMEGAPVWGQKL